MLDSEKIEKSLKLLGELLDRRQLSPLQLIVCGGSSLIVTGLVSRTTRDVDVLGTISPSSDGSLVIHEIESFSPQFLEVVDLVAREFGLDKEWLNSGPTMLVRFGLPKGFQERLQSRLFGPALTIHFISRWDQIHFKIYAARNKGPGRHVEDLLALKPTEAELLSAARWLISRDPPEPLREILKEMLNAIGYPSVAGRI